MTYSIFQYDKKARKQALCAAFPDNFVMEGVEAQVSLKYRQLFT